MTICFASIYQRCKDLSSFEGRHLTDGEGESLYSVVHISDQDKDLLLSLARKTTEQVNSYLSSALGDLSLDTDSDAPSTTDTAILIEELIVTGVMSAWLEDKSIERSNAYRVMFLQQVSAMRSSLRPTLNENY